MKPLLRKSARSSHHCAAFLRFCSMLIQGSAICTLISAACSNYSLRDQLENPGGAGSNLSTLTIFVTASTYAANLNVAGPDNICQQDLANPKGPGNGTWRALLGYTTRRACSTANCGGGATENLNWALRPNQSYARPDRTYIGRTGESSLFILPLAAGFSPVPGTKAWSGIDTNWLNSLVCSDWITTSGATSGMRAAADAVTIAAISEAAEICSSSLALICVEQP